ncbi:diaminopimelate decarboxylase [Candidatus Albibeggiatoa sp. nov. NOAA]|uniref:diaminopimelate decarboxylase n=1 Tax=Candidatus Albibeggiatoa sp. nov. NOAA TaxID=3162724 RepID=UPI0032F6D4F4|nr:diaminopimelate decarboxylase [Thiotrichaceae bacterium]
MDYFAYRGDDLYAEEVKLADIAAQFDTPCYVYSRATLERHWHAFDKAFGDLPHLVCYAVKANSNIAILNLLAKMGSGFDIVSVGELERVLKAGGEASKVVFSGVGKSHAEIRRAIEVGIRCFNVESEAELERIQTIAQQIDKVAPVSLRVNPDVDAKTHPYISTGLKENKFGIDVDTALEVYQHAASLSHLNVVGVDCHIGSQLTENEPFIAALERILNLINKLEKAGITLDHIDLGGGLGVRYQDEQPPEPQQYVEALQLVERLAGKNVEILIEPGRAIMANAGVLVTKVEYLKTTKDKNFAIVDAAMNDLIRPSLYAAWQEILPVNQQINTDAKNYDIVGPICETGDFLGKQRELAIEEGDLLAVRSSGAYGFTMSSNYNTRPRAVELLVDGEKVHEIRKREPLESLYELEQIID